MASDLTDRIKLSIQETAMRLIGENNKALGSPDLLIKSLQSHAESIAPRMERMLSDDSDFGPTDDEALHDVTREFFYKFDLARVIASTNQASIQKLATLIEFKNSESFRKEQRLFRSFCELGKVPSFDYLTQQLEAFIDGAELSEDFKFLSDFESGSPRLIGKPKLPSDLIRKSEVDIESTLSKIRPRWHYFITQVADDLCKIDQSENPSFAIDLVKHLEEQEIQKNDFKSLYRIEHSLKSSHQILGAPKIRGGIAALLNLTKITCQSRFENVFSDAWAEIEKFLDKDLIKKLTMIERLQHFDPYTLLLSAAGISTKGTTLIYQTVDDAFDSYEYLYNTLSENLRHVLNDSGWINESGSLNLSKPTSDSEQTIGDLIYNRHFTEARIDGVSYSFTTKMQRWIFEWLIEGVDHGLPSIAEVDLLEKLQRACNKDHRSKSLRDAVFKSGGIGQKQHPAWGKLIILRDKHVSLVTNKAHFKG